jgi:GNAT superfamily N-acetyltransferase
MPRVIREVVPPDTGRVFEAMRAARARGRGHGRALLEWLADEAVRCGCDQLHLDSGVGPEREDAHRLYFNAGLRITGYHFAKGLGR